MKFYVFFPLTNFIKFFKFNNLNFYNFFLNDLKFKKFSSKLSILKYFNIYNSNFLQISQNVLKIKFLYFEYLRQKIFKFIEDSHFSDILIRYISSISNMKTGLFINRCLKDQLTYNE